MAERLTVTHENLAGDEALPAISAGCPAVAARPGRSACQRLPDPNRPRTSPAAVPRYVPPARDQATRPRRRATTKDGEHVPLLPACPCTRRSL